MIGSERHKKSMCPFCNIERSRIGLNSPDRDPLDVSSRILFENGSVYACAGLSPLTFPYVLVFTKRHFRSFANSNREERRDTLNSFDILLKSKLFRSGRLLVFEHGDVCPRPNTQCLDHCHLHVMDAGLDIISQFQKSKPDAKTVLVSIDNPLSSDENYLLIGNYDGGSEFKVYVAPNPTCGFQYFRRMVAYVAEIPKFEWQDVLNEKMTQRLLDAWPYSK